MGIFKKLKRLERLEKALRISNEMLDIQGANGNYNVDEYMLGLYNGMEYIISFFEVREPKFIDGKWKKEQVNAKELYFKNEVDKK